MRYPAQHKEETRRRLVESSAALAKTEGFGTTGVDALMSAVGLSGGAFYSHFASKSDLLNAIVQSEIENSSEMLAGDETAAPDHVEKCLRRYLSSSHAANPDTGCVIPALGAEIARADPAVRETIEKGLKKVQKSWGERLGDDDAGWALISQCVGAILLSRIVASERTRQEILGANRRHLKLKGRGEK